TTDEPLLPRYAPHPALHSFPTRRSSDLTYSFGFNLQIPLSNKAERADHDRAIGAKVMATSQIDAVAQQIALEVRNAMNQVEMNRSEEHTSELQSRFDLVCRLLLEK